MSVVTDYVVNLIAKQVEDYRLVVWYDPEAFTRRSPRNLTCRTRQSPGTTAAS